MELKLNVEVKERRRLFNVIQELKGNIRVFCRCRCGRGRGGEGLPFLAVLLPLCQRLMPLLAVLQRMGERLRQSGIKEMINPVYCTCMASLW